MIALAIAVVVLTALIAGLIRLFAAMDWDR